MRNAVLIWLAAALLPLAATWATSTPLHLSAHATDQTGTLSAAQLAKLNSELTALEKAKGAQLVVLMVPTTAPQGIDAYSIAVAEANEIGRKGTDDGVLMLIAKNDHHARIEVGYGLEGAIPDVAASRIIREYMTPKFRAGDFDGGIEDAVGALTKLINGEPLPPPMDKGPRSRTDASAGDWMHFAVIALFLGFFLRSFLGRLHIGARVPIGGLLVGGVLALLAAAWIPALIGALVGGLAMIVPGGAGRFIGGGLGGGWGGFGGGGFGGGLGGGGMGGGGFSGGGGSFGGGGASGSW